MTARSSSLMHYYLEPYDSSPRGTFDLTCLPSLPFVLIASNLI